MIASYYVDQI